MLVVHLVALRRVRFLFVLLSGVSLREPPHVERAGQKEIRR